MVNKTGKKMQVDKDCYSMSLERVEYIYDNFDQVWVSFSGGKDSTACLNLAIEVATAKKKLPVNVVSFDEEAIPPQTVEYMERVRSRDDVNFLWMCVPIEHRNACSKSQPYWYPWAPEDKHLWVRDLPEGAITTPLTKKRCGIPEQDGYLYDPSKGSVATILGIRTQESLTRFRSVASKRGDRAYIQPPAEFKHVQRAYPIYDWNAEDVWLAPEILNWDYNRAYDVMTKAGVPLASQRCCPPFGEQPLRGLHRFKTCWPDLWAKMVNRVHGAATAARYANTDLYGFGIKEDSKPEGITWQSLTMATIAKLSPDSQKEVSKAIRACMKNHTNLCDDPVPDEVPHARTGWSWKILYTCAAIGGDKFGRQSQKMRSKSIQNRKKNGILG